MSGIGEVALVTGGGTGIGKAVSQQLVAAGAKRLYITYSRSAAEAEATADELRAQGADVTALQSDVSDPEAVRALAAKISEEAGRLDHLVNNAGITELIPFDDLDAITQEVWDRLWRTNVLGTFELTRAVAPLLKEAHGSVVNIASIAARRGVGSSLPYGVTKAAVVQMTRGFAVALAPEVRVNAVSAGTVRTRWHDQLVGSDVAQERQEAEAKAVPLQRLADADDIAASVVGLLAMPFVTGEDLLADGGKGLKY